MIHSFKVYLYKNINFDLIRELWEIFETNFDGRDSKNHNLKSFLTGKKHPQDLINFSLTKFSNSKFFYEIFSSLILVASHVD